METKKFVYEIVVEGIPYNEETATQIYGENSYNSDFPEDVFVRERIYDLLKDAQTQRLWFKTKAVTKPVQDETRHNAYLKLIDKSIEFYEKVRDSLKLVRTEIPDV